MNLVVCCWVFPIQCHCCFHFTGHCIAVTVSVLFDGIKPRRLKVAVCAAASCSWSSWPKPTEQTQPFACSWAMFQSTHFKSNTISIQLLHINTLVLPPPVRHSGHHRPRSSTRAPPSPQAPLGATLHLLTNHSKKYWVPKPFRKGNAANGLTLQCEHV